MLTAAPLQHRITPSAHTQAEAGSTGLLGAALVLIIMLIATGVADVGHYVAERAQLSAAADAAALAAAVELSHGGNPHQGAQDMANANHVTLEAPIHLDGMHVKVSVNRQVQFILLPIARMSASARAVVETEP